MQLTACITTFNRPEFLSESLGSLCNQTNNNFQILILDNGSDLKTENIILNYKKLRDNIIYEKHKPISISKQRNLALEIVKTNYLGFLDDDDFWDRNKVQEFYHHLYENNNQNIALWYSGFKFFTDNKKKREFTKLIADPKSSLRDLLLQKGDFTGSASNPIIKVEIARNINGFDNNILTGEDYDFYLRLSEKNKFYFTNKPLTFIRQHQGSRLGGRLRDYIRTEIIIYRKFSGLFKDIDQILRRKIATKLIRIKKPRKARKIINLNEFRFNEQYFINCIVYIFSYFGEKNYLYLHKNILKVIKIIRRN